MVVPSQVSFTEKTAFIKKEKKKKSLPSLPNIFGVVTLHIHIFLFGPTKHAKHWKHGWTDLCRINPGPRIDPFTSHAQIYVIENVDTSALHKILINEYIFKIMQLSKEEYAIKRTHNGCFMEIESPVTQDNNCSASLGNPPDDEQLPSWQHFQSEAHSH